MKIQLSPALLTQPRVWLAAIAIGLAILHVQLNLQANLSSNLGMQILGWLAIGIFLWRRRQKLQLKSDPLSSLVGLSLIAFVLVKSLFLTEEQSFINLSPLISAIGLVLLASGIRGFLQYWRELLVIICVGGPDALIHVFVNIAPITAKFASYLMWYGGLKVLNQGVFIFLPTGSVEVDSGCDGTGAIAHLLGLSLIFLMLFSIQGVQKYIVPIVAISLAFFINALRVILMVLLIADQQPKAFEYWHTGDGSNLFSLIAVLLFGGYCYWVLSRLPTPLTPPYDATGH